MINLISNYILSLKKKIVITSNFQKLNPVDCIENTRDNLIGPKFLTKIPFIHHQKIVISYALKNKF